jgi:hypothetical protein
MSEPISLYVPADAQGMVALTREWLAARIVFVVGFVAAIAFFGYYTYSHWPSVDSTGDTYADNSGVVSNGTVPDATSANPATKEGFMLCRMMIGLGESFGVLPNTMKYAGGPAKTDVQGRYICTAMDTSNVRYSLNGELVCKDLNNPNCVSMVTVTKADGTVMFQRQGGPSPVVDSTAPPANGSAPADANGANATPDANGAAPATPDNSATPQQQP